MALPYEVYEPELRILGLPVGTVVFLVVATALVTWYLSKKRP